MAETKTNLDLDAIEEREQAATQGPWHVHDGRRDLTRWVQNEDGTLDISFGYVGNCSQGNAEFVAHARTDMPDLIAEVKRLRFLVGGLEQESEMLTALRAAGVEGWEGYGGAIGIVDEQWGGGR